MTTPRTIAGQAALSGMRPHVKRALAQTILAIEAEAIAAYVEALREADGVLRSVAAKDARSVWDTAMRLDLVERAYAAHRLLGPLIVPADPLEGG